MKPKIITLSDPKVVRAVAGNPAFVSAQPYVGQPNGHLFKAGDVCELHSLQSYPEFNGTEAVILAIREDGPRGRAYYISGEIAALINWVYESRLKLATGGTKKKKKKKKKRSALAKEVRP